MTFQVTDNKIEEKVTQFQTFLKDVFGISLSKEKILKLLIEIHQEKHQSNTKSI